MTHLIFFLLAQGVLVATGVTTPDERVFNTCRLPGAQKIAIQSELHFGLENPNTPVPVQAGCCVLKQGARSKWKYIDTDRRNCADTARRFRVPYSFYEGRACQDVPR